MDWNNELTTKERWVLFGCSVVFIILPLIGNLVQLHKHLQVWIRDIYSKYTVQAWIRFYLRLLYMLTIVLGSAFAAVDVCNSNIFHLQMFNMGLNQRQQATFKNQRILSTVLLENIPQLIIQIIYTILCSKSNISSITLIAMIFSVVSIVSSIFNYKSSSLFLQCEAITLIEMNIVSKQLGNTQQTKFRRIIVHHRIPICQELAKIINVNHQLIEILLPIQTKTGAKLIFLIRSDSSDEDLGSQIINIVKQDVNSGRLAQVTYTYIHAHCIISFVYVPHFELC